MRLKIIAVFSLIVLLLGGLMFVVSVYASSAPIDAQQAPRALEAAVVELEVEGMATERWLATQAKDPSVREPFGVSEKVGEARGRKATDVCDALRTKAAKAPELLGVMPDLTTIPETATSTSTHYLHTDPTSPHLRHTLGCLRADHCIPAQV